VDNFENQKHNLLTPERGKLYKDVTSQLHGDILLKPE